jgi:hypothetical protein
VLSVVEVFADDSDSEAPLERLAHPERTVSDKTKARSDFFIKTDSF